MALPSTVVFAAGDLDYITKLNQMIADLNAGYALAALFVDSSATSLSVATGTKVFTLASGSARGFQIGMPLRAASLANPANYMDGQVTAYAHPTLTLNVTTIGGAGTLADWRIGLGALPASITGLAVGTATALQLIRVNSAGTALEGYTYTMPAIDSLLSQSQLGGF